MKTPRFHIPAFPKSKKQSDEILCVFSRSGAFFRHLRLLNAADDQHRRDKQQKREHEGQTAVQTGEPPGQIAEGRGERDGGGHDQGVQARPLLRGDVELEQRVFARVHQCGGHGGDKHIEQHKAQTVRGGEDQHEGGHRVQRKADPQRRAEFRGAHAVLDSHHENDHDRGVQNGEQGQIVFRKPQPLRHIQSEKVCAHHIRDIQDHRDGDGFEHAPVLQQTGDQLAVFPEHVENGHAFGLSPADSALLGLMAKPEGDERFCEHRQRKEQVQHPDHRHHGIGADEQAGKRREKDRHKPADVHPGVDSDQILWTGVLDKQTVPGRLVDLLKAVEQRGNQEQPEIIGDGPHQTGQRPPEEIAHHGGGLAPELVR